MYISSQHPQRMTFKKKFIHHVDNHSQIAKHGHKFDRLPKPRLLRQRERQTISEFGCVARILERPFKLHRHDWLRFSSSIPNHHRNFRKPCHDHERNLILSSLRQVLSVGNPQDSLYAQPIYIYQCCFRLSTLVQHRQGSGSGGILGYSQLSVFSRPVYGQLLGAEYNG